MIKCIEFVIVFCGCVAVLALTSLVCVYIGLLIGEMLTKGCI